MRLRLFYLSAILYTAAMAKYESVNLLYKLLKQARYPVSKKQLQAQLECSPASVERYLTELRDTYGQNVEYNREYNGYQLSQNSQDIELPSHLFTTQEINAILLLEQLIDDLEPGFLKHDLQSVKSHLATLKTKFTGAISANHEKRIRMINMGKRHGKINHLSTLTRAVLERQNIKLRYDSRSTNTAKSTRLLSPQRLTHYRDNWYLDAWCHTRQALRTFALERIEALEMTQEGELINLSAKQLDAHYAQTFGIFGGSVTATAVLKFTPHRSQWVAEEVWHQHQRGTWLDDGSYQLEIPYGNDTELIGDILKYGDQVEVLAPPELRSKLKVAAHNLSQLYAKT